MNRTRLLPVLAMAAALALVSCSSTSGTPSAADSAGADQTSTTQDAVGTTDAAADATDDQDTITDDADEGAANGNDAGADANADSSDADADATTTVGDGTLDGQTAAWFSTACTGMQPIGDLLVTAMTVAMTAGMGGSADGATDSAAPDSPDAQQLQKQLVDVLNNSSESLGDTATKLQSMPPPSFDKGGEIAGAFTTYLAQSAPKLSDAAKKVAASKVTDMESLMAAFDQLDSMSDDLDGLDGADLLDQFEIDEQTSAAIEALPACKTFEESMGGFGGLGG